MEAEYIALVDAAKEGLWLSWLVSEIFSEKSPKVILLEDNQAAIKLAKNEILSDRSKHIDVRFHFLRHHVQAGTIELKYCPTEKMVADALTKPLQRVKLSQHVADMGLH